jgi:L-alanine-DL-glutamate epimerase-like enolase superfamily enzyme
MKIDGIDVVLFTWDGIPPARYGDRNPATTGTSELALVTVRAGGAEGHGFLGASFRSAKLDVHGLVTVLRPAILGMDALDREAIWQRMNGLRRAASYRAIGALDVAIWDLTGKLAGLPCWALLGGYRRAVPAYVSSGSQPAVSAYVEQALAFKESGLRAYKIHPPHDADGAIAVSRAVRDAVGPDVALMIDPGASLSYPDAIRLGRAIEELGFVWYEDPLQEDDIYNYVKLKAKLDVPIMATEYASGGFEAYAAWVHAQATDYLRGDPAVKGGLTPLVKAAHLAEAFQMGFEPHHGGNSLMNFANVNLLMAVRNASYFEVLLPDGAQKFGVLNDIALDATGNVVATAGPGLGAELDIERIRRNELARLA